MSRCLAVAAGTAAVLATLVSGGPAGAAAGSGVPREAAGTAATAHAALRVATRSLPPAVRGLSYLTVLTAAGGAGPYTWSATTLPAGLQLSPGGLLSGYPTARGGQAVAVRVRDAGGQTAQAALRLAVPATLPGGCVARACALLSPSPRTVAVPASAVVAVTGPAASGQAAPGQAGELVLRGGPAVIAGDTLTVAATGHDPSGMVAVAGSVTAWRGVRVVRVRSAAPASAFEAGTVQAVTAGTGTTAGPARALQRQGAPAPAAAGNVLSCSSRVTSRVHGLTVTPALAPAVALQWQRGLDQRPASSPGGVRPGAIGPGEIGPSGSVGLRLFQFTLAGTITVNLGVSVSGPSRCTMTLPAVRRSVAAGGLGAVALRLRPSLTLVTTGPVDTTTSVTLTCAAAYRLLAGQVTRTDYCAAAGRRPRLSAGGGATVTATIGVSAAVGGLSLVSGTATAALHAAYQAGRAPATETDARSGFDLAAAMGNIWTGSARATVASGTAYTGAQSADGGWVTRGGGTGKGGAPGPAVITVTPAVAYPWSAAVCGYPAPSFGRAAVTVAGRGFAPGEGVTAGAGWRTSRRAAHAGTAGSFTVTEPVGEVPGVLDRAFGVTASGTGGPAARSAIVLDADGCLRQTGRAGRVSLRWGGNGFDPRSALSLSVNGVVSGYAVTDAHGSGGATAVVGCPSAGRYHWQVAGTANGAPAAAAGWLGCAARPVSPGRPPAISIQEAGAPASAEPVSSPWRVPPARPPLA